MCWCGRWCRWWWGCGWTGWSEPVECPWRGDKEKTMMSYPHYIGCERKQQPHKKERWCEMGKEVKMELTVLERYMIRAMRPQKATFMEQSVAEDVWGKVKVSEVEHAKAGGDGLATDFGREFEFGASEMDYLKRRCEAMDREAGVIPAMVSVMRKIRG